MNRKERQERKDSRKELNLGHYRLRWLTMRIHLEFVRIPGLNQQLFRHTQLGEQSIPVVECSWAASCSIHNKAAPHLLTHTSNIQEFENDNCNRCRLVQRPSLDRRAQCRDRSRCELSC